MARVPERRRSFLDRVEQGRLSPEPWLPRLVCPDCRMPVGPVGSLGRDGGVHCALCGTTFEQRGNLWRFLTNARERAGRGVYGAVSRRSRA